MSGEFTPVDRNLRQQLLNELNTTFFVEAGAGTGKTSVIVERISRLITTGTGEIGRIAAITFTEAAAAELRDRVRCRLEEYAEDGGLSERARANCRRALDHFDDGIIQTLHSFAGALLREKPLEAHLPPNFRVSPEMEAGIRFENNWQSWLDGVMERDELAPALLQAMQFGLKTEGLKSAARVMHDNYDRLPERFERGEEPDTDLISKLVEASGRVQDLSRLVKEGRRDTLYTHCKEVSGLIRNLDLRGLNTAEALAEISRFGKLSCSRGNKDNWLDDPCTGRSACTVLKDLLKELDCQVGQELAALRRVSLVPLLEDLACSIKGWVKSRVESGSVEFHDLLVLARDMLRDNAEVRRYFQKRFSHILIDEFQDTDPIQAEIAFFLAADSNRMGEGAVAAKEWQNIKIAPGKLFVVGDPKQSIYRFRRADIAAVQKVSRLLSSPETILRQNFRSQKRVIDWVNAVFHNWMGSGESSVQATYSGIYPRWDDTADEPEMGVYRFGEAIDSKAYRVKKQESETIAGIAWSLKNRSLKVRDKASSKLRPVNYGDMCILMPVRTVLPHVERALEGEGIPYRIESESFVLGTQDVADLLHCLKAIDCPVDRVSLVAALRSTAFGLSDEELADFVGRGGVLDYTVHGNAGGKVANAMGVLADFNLRRQSEPVDRLIESFIRERCMAELAFGRERPRERLRRLKMITEQARAFSSIGERSLRVFIEWMQAQIQENVRMVEIPVPEPDEDAVRIMTVHAAKGLEFPVVILAGLDTGKERGKPVIFGEGGSLELKIGSGDRVFATTGYEAAEQLENEAGEAEKIRLMYVAATRARDYLLISCFRKETSGQSSAINACIEKIACETGCSWDTLDCPSIEVAPPQIEPECLDKGYDTLEERKRWIDRRENIIKAASIPQAEGTTRITRQDKDEPEGGEAYFRKGRGGSNLGRAVHSVLQTIDLEAGENLDKICRSQADAEGIPGREKEVARLVRKALEMPAVRRAVKSGRYYRELFFGLPYQNRQIEGFIDLLFEEGESLVIADYKTDVNYDLDDPVKAEQYRLQAGVYALAVEELAGKTVSEVILIFLVSGKEESLIDVKGLKSTAVKKLNETLLPRT